MSKLSPFARRWLLIIPAAACLFIFGLVFWPWGSSRRDAPSEIVRPKSDRLNFERVEKGMTAQEVEAIYGRPSTPPGIQRVAGGFGMGKDGICVPLGFALVQTFPGLDEDYRFDFTTRDNGDPVVASKSAFPKAPKGRLDDGVGPPPPPP